MNRRQAFLGLAGLASLALGGCSKMSFLPQPRQRTVAGYDAVQTGMTEVQVRGYLGEPVRRRRINLEGMSRPATALTFLVKQRIVTVTLEHGAVIGKSRV